VIKDKTTLILAFSLREKGSIPLSLRERARDIHMDVR